MQTLLRGVMQRKCVEQQGHCNSQIIVCQVFIQTSCHGQSKHDADYRQRKHHLMLLRDPCYSMGNTQTGLEHLSLAAGTSAFLVYECYPANQATHTVSTFQCANVGIKPFPHGLRHRAWGKRKSRNTTCWIKMEPE